MPLPDLKRCLDATAGAIGLVILSPLLVATAILIRIVIGKPVLFRQVRPGLHGEPFTLVKFRTMREARDRNGEPLPDAHRMTRLGSFLRASSVDELPALWNVVSGSMSLVGPRPLLMEYLPLYSAEQARRHDVRPGLTGWAQVNGRNAVSWEKKFELDVWYVDNRSFALDLRILLMTVKKVIAREGIAQEGHVTVERFQGSGTARSEPPLRRQPS